MTRKFLCLFLSILMLLTTVLTGCSTPTTDEDEDETDNSAKTITMWVMTPDYETEEEEAAAKKAQELVQKAFSNITKSKFKTNVELKFCSASEYYDKLEATILAERQTALLKEEAEDALTQFLRGKDSKQMDKWLEEFYTLYPQYQQFRDDLDEEEEVVEEETERNEFGVSEIKYPKSKENQVDIFYLSGQDRYLEYYANEWLAGLDEELSLTAMRLTDYITSSLLNGVQLSGSVYAIPNNVQIGEYTYALIDKEYFDMYYNKIDSVENVLDLERFLNDMKNMNEENGKTPADEGYVVPLASTFEQCMNMLVWYWEMSYTDRSVYETYYDEESGCNYVLGCTYKVEVEKYDEDTGETALVIETRVVPYVKLNQMYKVNEQGQYVDKDGNVLNYRYVTAENVRYQVEGEDVKEDGIKDKDIKIVEIVGTDEEKAALRAQAGGMYLVDENGLSVSPENDKRVIVATGVEGEDGTLEPMEIYDEEGNLITIDDRYDLELVPEEVLTPVNVDGWARQTFYYDYHKNDMAQDGEDILFSTIGTIYKSAADRARGEMEVSFESLLASEEYRDLYAILKNYEYEGYYGTPDADKNQKAAVSFINGDARIKAEYEKKGVYVQDGREYYMFVAEYPEATDVELYGNMFAVYANSTNLTRSMEVITCLNTNAELRNLLQYGVEGWHYERDEDTGLVSLLNNAEYGIYRMNQEQTGNCFIVYPTVEQGADAWTYAKIQNTDSLINPLLGFDFNSAAEGSEYNMDVELIDYLNQLSKEVSDQIAECADRNELMSLLEELGTTYSPSKNEKIDKATNAGYDPAGGTGQINVNGSSSPFAVYKSWLASYGYEASGKTSN